MEARTGLDSVDQRVKLARQLRLNVHEARCVHEHRAMGAVLAARQTDRAAHNERPQRGD